jgi:YqaJ-like recombinase protein
MPMEILNCEQGSEEWFRARMGIATASEFSTIMAKGKDGGASVTRRAYLYKLAGEILTGKPAESFASAHMARGNAMEGEARDLYALMHDVDPVRVGFIKNGPKGCSPDSLIGDKGALEIKTALPHLLIGYLIKDEFPPEHKAQCQGVLWVGEREWVDIGIYWPELPLLEKRAVRDEPYIKAISSAVDAFNEELQDIVARIRAYGMDPAAAAAAASTGAPARAPLPAPSRERLKAVLLAEIAAITSIGGVAYWATNNAARLGLLTGPDRTEVDTAIANRQDAINHPGKK